MPAIPTHPARCWRSTADHGNADESRDADGRPVTAHSLNPVPAGCSSVARARGVALADGVLGRRWLRRCLPSRDSRRGEGMTGRSRIL